MSKHVFLHAWSTHSDTLEIRIQHNVTPDQSRSDLHRIIDILILFMRGSRKFCQRGSNSATLTIILDRVPLKADQCRPASETPFKWRFAGVHIMVHIECWFHSFENFREFQEIQTSIAKKTYIFVISQGVRTPCHPLWDPRMLLNTQLILGRSRWGSQ